MSEVAVGRADAYRSREIDATAGSIEAVQRPSGMIPWFPGGHADPWNHVEAAMALSATGRTAAAARAYEWLCSTQRADGSWHAYYGPDGEVEQARIDTNFTAYVATGVRHHYLATGDLGFLEAMWPVVEPAVEFVLRLQRPTGEVPWAASPDGEPESIALLAACSSLCTSLQSAVACARELGLERPSWDASRRQLERAVVARPWSFAPKGEFAMDWYYPVLAGAVRGRAASARFERGRGRFVLEGTGVLCRSDRRWVTTAETAECAIACARIGRVTEAAELLGATRAHRTDEGSYLTGLVHPGLDEFPRGERTTYSAAAVVLAADVLSGGGATSEVLAGGRVGPA